MSQGGGGVPGGLKSAEKVSRIILMAPYYKFRFQQTNLAGPKQLIVTEFDCTTILLLARLTFFSYKSFFFVKN